MADKTGSRRHRVLIERLVDPPMLDPFGEPIPTWEEHASRWAFVDPLVGREFFQAQQTQTDVDHTILLPYDSLTAQITPEMRITHLGKVFDIEAVINPNTRNAEIQVMAKVHA
jgi:SPP1 family predicted phage head-tail adaptor